MPVLARLALSALVLSLVAVAPARAAFPGGNAGLTFGSDRTGDFELFSMKPDGSGETPLTNNAAFDGEASWSPDGRKIAFQSDRDGNTEVYVMNADGSGQTRLTNNPAFDGDPAWSPDGTKLAFGSDRDDPTQMDVYVMNANGGGQMRLTANPGVFDGVPAWSPTGRIAFESSRDGDFEIYVMNADGSGPTNLTNNAVFDGHAAWSPDGSRLTFDTDRDAGNFEVYAMNADGGAPTNLTNNAAKDEFPDWSPDGQRIAFESDRDGDIEIHAMNAGGSGQIPLTSDPSSDRTPAWQPLTISISDEGVVEGVRAIFTVSLSSASAGTVTVGFATADGSARAPGDYDTQSGGLAFAPGQTSSTVSVPLAADGSLEPNETFSVNLTSATGATVWDGQGLGTIVDDDLPVLGKSVNVEPLRGKVFVSVPAKGARAAQSVPGLKGRRFVPLREARRIPVGSFLDARRGTVRLRSARAATGSVQSGDFAAGVFQVLQSRRKRAKGLTELRLKGGSFRRCRRGARRSGVAVARRSRRTIRRLRSNARGRFRTRTTHSAATTRGTKWDTLERCDGTLTKVRRGKVAVRDFRRRKTILVRAGKSYLARARR